MDEGEKVIVEDVKTWRQTVWEGGVGRRQLVTLRGEFRGNPNRASGWTNLIIPGTHGDNAPSFASLGGYVVAVENVDSTNDEEVRCAAEMTGVLRVDANGQLSLGDASLTLHARQRGPYERWQARQCRLSGIRVGQRPRFKPSQTETEVTAHLTANAHKQILWVGSKELNAYGDVVRTEHGVDRKIADRLIAQNVVLGNRDTPQKLAALLDGVSAEDTALVIIARGGGDIGDLARLEDAALLRAAKECTERVPIILAVGHKADELLLSDAVTWSVGVPANLGAVLRPFCHGWGGASADRKAKEFQRHQTHSLKTSVHQLREKNKALASDIEDMTYDLNQVLRELENARRQAHQAHTQSTLNLQRATQRFVDGLADQARRQITRTYRLACLTMALLTATVWLAISAVAPRFVQRHTHSAMAMGGIAMLICLHLALAPRRLGKRPRFASSKPIDRQAAFCSVRTVRGYNRALHAPEVAPTTQFH